MIKRTDLLSLGYYRSAVFTGSDKAMRYRVERINGTDETEPDVFQATVWPGPYAYDATDPALRQTVLEPFSEEGLCRIADRLNELSGSFAENVGILDREPWQKTSEEGGE